MTYDHHSTQTDSQKTYVKQERLPAMNEIELTASETAVFVDDADNPGEVTVILSGGDGEGEIEIVGSISELLDLTSKIRQALPRN